MYRYAPPKSNIWGHALGDMPPAQLKERFTAFLERAVAEYSSRGGSLRFFVGEPPAVLPLEAQRQWGHVSGEDVKAFEQLLGATAHEGAFHSLTPEQCEMALTELAGRSSLLPGTMFLQSVEITRWLVVGSSIPTQSQVTLYYGAKPHISTLLQFETVSAFKFVSKVLQDLKLCRLNEKHLKPDRQSSKK